VALVLALGLLAMAAAVPLARAATTWPDSPTCFWGRPNDPNVVNVAYPDKAATYWSGRPFLPPGSELVLHGRYPHARYMSFNAYNAQLQPVDGLADVKIAADAGSTNPFVVGADRTAAARDYTLRIVQGPAPATRAPNTLYMDAPIVLYRVYVPDSGRDLTGDVGLPSVTLRLADGSTSSMSSACKATDATTPLGSDAAGLPVQSSFRDGDLPGTPLTTFPAKNPVHWEKFFNLQHVNAAFLTDGTPLRPVVDDNLADSKGGYLSNTDNSYAVGLGNRGFGPVLVLHGRAPVTPHTRDGASTMPTGDMRYWSLCTNERNSTRYIDCAVDEDVPLAADGTYTVVVSAPADRPANAQSACGVAWLAWGTSPETLVILRHMLPDPAFTHAIQNVEKPDQLVPVLGDYLPTGTHTTKAAFESRGC